jgi:hypothetical protein
VAQPRLSVRKIRDVLRLKSEAQLSDRQIAAVLGSARSTVQECLRRARAAGVCWPLPEEVDDEALWARLYPHAPVPPALIEVIRRVRTRRPLLERRFRPPRSRFSWTYV